MENNKHFFTDEVSHTHNREMLEIAMPPELLAEIVSAAEKAGMTVGNYIAKAVTEFFLHKV